MDSMRKLIRTLMLAGGIVFGVSAMPSADSCLPYGTRVHHMTACVEAGSAGYRPRLFPALRRFAPRPPSDDLQRRIGALVAGSYGYIDVAGRFVIAPAFGSASSFNEGMAIVSPESGGHLLIDETGEIVFRFHHQPMSAVRDGMIVVVDSAGLYGYVDASGRVVVSPRFIDAEPFSEGLAAVLLGGGMGSGKWGFVNKKGEVAISPRFYDVRAFHQGLAGATPGRKGMGIHRSIRRVRHQASI
jgi:hypothetical protein